MREHPPSGAPIRWTLDDGRDFLDRPELAIGLHHSVRNCRASERSVSSACSTMATSVTIAFRECTFDGLAELAVDRARTFPSALQPTMYRRFIDVDGGVLEEVAVV